jgi:hypothetical protein
VGTKLGTVKPRWIAAKTYPDAPHEYLRRQDDPAMFDHYQQLIRGHGVLEKFTLRGRTASYRYYYEDGYKYWTVGVILDRAEVLR